QVGDRVVRVNGADVSTWDQFDLAVLMRANRETTLVVERDGSYVDLSLTPDAEGRFDAGTIGVAPVLRPQVMVVNSNSPAGRAGLEVRDVILAVNGEQGLGREGIITRIQKSPDTAMTF